MCMLNLIDTDIREEIFYYFTVNFSCLVDIISLSPPNVNFMVRIRFRFRVMIRFRFRVIVVV